MKYAFLAIFVLLALAALGLAGIGAVTLLSTKYWLVRLLDFPRLQFLILSALVGVSLLFFVRRYPLAARAALTLTIAAILIDAAVLWPYVPTGGTAVSSCPVERTLKVMIANVQLGNRQSATILDEVRAQKPDIFLAMEIDDWWDKTLEPLTADLPYTAKKITGSYYGIRLFSRLPLIDPDIRFLAGRDTPAVVTGVKLGNGDTLTFLGMHPRPPLVGQSALPRDAELYAAGKILRDRPGAAILAGDLNATPWADGIERMRRVAGLIDPRRGYGYVYTFNATIWWAKWPLDQIFFKPGFAVISLERLGADGSDHYPFVVRLCRDVDRATLAAPAESEDDRETIEAANRAATAAAEGQ